MNNTNNISARDTFNRAKDMLFKAWIGTPGMSGTFGGDAKACMAWVEGRKLSQSELRLEVELSNTNNIFSFGVTPNQANTTNVVFPTERRLQLQDSLVASEYGFYVAKPSSRNDSAFLLRTYGNTVDFSAAQALALDGELYSNGEYTLKVNNDVVAPLRGMFNHWYKPQTQQTAALGAGSPGDQVRGAEDGQITQEPNLLLIGSKNYVPQVILNSNLVPDMQFTRLILIYRGVLAQNSTVIN